MVSHEYEVISAKTNGKLKQNKKFVLIMLMYSCVIRLMGSQAKHRPNIALLLW